MSAPTNPTVLVVDDDPTFRRFAELSLGRRGYTCVLASNAAEARERLEGFGPETFCCVVTDHRMPGEDGVSLLGWLRDRDSSLAGVLATAEGERRLVGRSLRAGACNFLYKPVGAEELRRAVALAATVTERRRQAAQLRLDVEQVGTVLKAAIEANVAHSGFALDFCFHPKHEAGGDFLVVSRLPDGREILLLTDVAGHDLRAAWVSAFFHGMAHGLIDSGAPLEEVFRRFNQRLLDAPVIGEQMSSLAVCALLADRASGRLRAYVCGSPAPVWVDPDGWACPLAGRPSSPLGWFDDLAMETASIDVPAGAVWIWTDGLEELASQQGASSLSVAHALLHARAAGAPPEWLADAADDVLALRLWPGLEPGMAAPDAPEPLVAEVYSPDQLAGIDGLQAGWGRSLDIALPTLARNIHFDLMLCAREALINALQHGCREGDNARFQIAWLPGERLLQLRVSDPGPGHLSDAAQLAEGDAGELADAHRGLLLMRSLPSRFTAARNGAELTLDFSLTGANECH
jgi:FixJ family two-component response regulator/anti-sigma regulatory factor (Ser/Thr protein kinase)